MRHQCSIAAQRCRNRLKNPPIGRKEYLEMLRRGVSAKDYETIHLFAEVDLIVPLKERPAGETFRTGAEPLDVQRCLDL